MDYSWARLHKLTPGKLSSKPLIGVIILGIVFFLSVGFYSPVLPGSQWSYLNNLTISSHPAIAHSSIATTVQNGSSARRLYIVDTSLCKIPNLDPWNESVNQLKKKCSVSDETDPKCRERDGSKNWIYAEGSKLIPNYTAISVSGHSKSSLRCCYHIIHRVEQPLHQFHSRADKTIKLSQKCHPISLYNSTDITVEFIKVLCMTSFAPTFNRTPFEEYFAFAQPDASAQKKISIWKMISANNPEVPVPPSIIILGIDTNSRLNSHRRLPRTLKLLQDLEAVELFGYTKVGDNTLPNSIPFLTGMTAPDMLRQCYPNEQGNFDGCPFIWKDFDRAGYLTASAEDAPGATSFNYHRNGFVRKPVDFYYRPFILASSARAWNIKCVGHYSTMELLLHYLDDILRRGSNGAPVFIHSWATFFSHECINSLRFVDDTITSFIERLDKQNTILLFMSDHGDRYGAFRETVMGWYEDRLPSMWIYLPEKVKKRWPQWQTNLQLNAQRLTSPFDLYHTFVQILHMYKINSNFTVTVPTPIVGQSLLEPIPEHRTCNQAGIPEAYCVCSEPKSIDPNTRDNKGKTLIKKVADAGLSYLRKMLPQKCATLKVKNIVSVYQRDSDDGAKVYVVAFYTEPGHYLLEATARVKNSSEDDIHRNDGLEDENVIFESYDSVSRISSMNSHRDCFKDTIWEKYCYCVKRFRNVFNKK